MKKTVLFGTFLGLFSTLSAQNPTIPIEGTKVLSDSIVKNGKLDRLEDLIFRAQVPFKMPDGINLQTDVYLPIFQDDMTMEVDLLGNKVNLTLLKRGTQYIMYDSLNGQPNPNPYQLPVIFTRTPYNKKGALEASIFSILGYSGMIQDLRGRYASDGVFFPLYSDSWYKRPYYPDRHILDITPDGSPHNAENFEDGANSIDFIKKNLLRTFDLNNDGIPDKTDLVYNGAIGMFGASALGYSQTQAAAARKINPSEPGLKSILPIVATGEFHKSTVFPNGTFREMLVTGWLTGQMVDLNDNLMSVDNGLQNDIHTSLDFGLPNKYAVADGAIDNYTVRKYSDGVSGQMPYSLGRSGFDIDYAPVNEKGESDPDGQFSRYTNMEVPSYYLSGWWDIFVDGTIETFNKQRYYVSADKGNKNKIKLVMGPWAHQTITDRTTGDVTYPENVLDITSVSLSDFGESTDLGGAANSEIFGWYRYTLNETPDNRIGEPKFILPRSNDWQKVLNGTWVRFPAEDYKIKFTEMMNFMLGLDGLKQVPVTVRVGSITIPFKIDVPKLEEPLIPSFSTEKLTRLNTPDFSQVPAMRCYIVGPQQDGIAGNEDAGNYWLGTDTFPLAQGVRNVDVFLYADGNAGFTPADAAGTRSYTHDPDNPVITLGGANMIEKTPVTNKNNQGQIDYANPIYKPYVLDRPDVLIFETPALTDTMSVIGFPQAVIYGTASPENADAGVPTDVDFYVRIIDVYPDGRELFVVEGGVNARAREYARSIAEGREDIHAPFTNIESGKLYEYYFDLLPIGYTFGKDHKIKFIVSSSDHPRYQSNPCIPMNEGEFFRRKPKESKTYIFNGQEMAARKSVQQIYFSPEQQTRVILPVFGSTKVTSTKKLLTAQTVDVQVYPNPASDYIQAFVNQVGQYNVSILNIMGQQLQSLTSGENIRMDISKLPAGTYILQVQKRNTEEPARSVKFVKN